MVTVGFAERSTYPTRWICCAKGPGFGSIRSQRPLSCYKPYACGMAAPCY